MIALRYFYSWVFMPLITGFLFGFGYLISKAFFKKHVVKKYVFLVSSVII